MEKCQECKRKHMINFKCRCGKILCVKHKNSEDHKCTFNYKDQPKEPVLNLVHKFNRL